jgi:4-aminobutyrate aminotransferase
MVAEGDVNLSDQRAAWQARNISAETRALLDADARYFLRQSLSTPVMNALIASEGIYLEDTQGRRIMDFHGNSVHQVGYRHPRVMAAVRQTEEDVAAVIVETVRSTDVQGPPPTTDACATPATARARC